MELTGRKLGKYEVVERLGRGGMADVYKAFQPGVERHVAIKVMHTHLADSEDFIARFRREAQSIGRLQHAHIVRIIDFDIEADVYYMVMDFIQGGTLQDYLKEKSPLSIGEATQITLQLIDALAYAHNQNMVHRDIKPGNVMFMDEARTHAVLTDFGIAYLLDDQFTQLTMTGASVGTPTYMSPETARGDGCDGRSDIYSLGVMLFEMVAGRAPYVANTPFSLMMKQANEPIPSPQSFNPHVPKAIEPILEKAMAKAPEERYQSAQEFGDALRTMLAGLRNEPASMIVPAIAATGSSATTANVKKEVDPKIRKRNRGLALAGGGVLLVTLLTTILLLSMGQPETNPPAEQPAVVAGETPESVAAQPTATAVVPTNTVPPATPTTAQDESEDDTPITDAVAEVEPTPTLATVIENSVAATLPVDSATTETITAPMALTETTAVAVTEPLESQTVPINDSPQAEGQLHFLSDTEGTTTAHIYLTNIDQPAEGNQYALWLLGDDDQARHLASFLPEQGHLIHEETLNLTADGLPLTAYHTALIGVESVENGGTTLPETILYRSELASEELLAPLQQLLDENTLDADAQGLIAAAQAQMALVADHGGFLQEALAADDIIEVHRHAEHLVNILDGENGSYYGDLDRDGVIQNPGNGVGVLAYLAEAHATYTTLAATSVNRYARYGLATLDRLQIVAADAKEKAAQLIATDTVAEAQPKANEFMAIVAALTTGADENQDGGIDPLQGEGGLNALVPLTRRLLTYHFVDEDATTAAAATLPTGILHFYKSLVVAAEPATTADDGGMYGGSYGNGYGSDGSEDTSTASTTIQNDAPTYADAFYLVIDGLLAPPPEHHYELWLTQGNPVGDNVGDTGNINTVESLVLGSLDLKFGHSSLTGNVPGDAFTDYNQAAIVVVPNDGSEATETIYVADRPAYVTDLLQNLLVHNEEARTNLVRGANQQLALANLHTTFLQDELDNDDLTEARRHAEHVYNILAGKAGQFFGDIDSDGMPQNPGDGVGVLSYLTEIESRLTTLLADEELASATRKHANDSLLLIQRNRDIIIRAEEVTMRVFAADTAAEIQLFEDEIKLLLNDALYGVDLDGNGVINVNVTEGGVNALAQMVVVMSGYQFEAP